jgi:hypothetical protein
VIFNAAPYQQAVSGNTMRTTSDVAYNASVYTGVLVYLGYIGSGQNGLYFFGGPARAHRGGPGSQRWPHSPPVIRWGSSTRSSMRPQRTTT